MTDTKGSILFFLDTHATVKRPELLKHLRDLGHDINDRAMRALIEDMKKT